MRAEWQTFASMVSKKLRHALYHWRRKILFDRTAKIPDGASAAHAFMPEPSFESKQPPDENWWERELNRNEKLMDKYMAAFGENPDKFKHPRDLYNKVHYDIDPPERPDEEAEPETEPAQLSDAEKKLNEIFDAAEKGEAAGDETAVDEALDAAFEIEAEGDDDFDNDPPDNEDYPVVAKLALKFAVQVMKVEDVPEDAEVLYLSAGKVGANLAGGHGLGYDDESICGNIVKCRWALADCEFCREMLGHLYERLGNVEFEEMRKEAQVLSAAIQERIVRLRKRVWW
jgi:hypothetical protein